MNTSDMAHYLINMEDGDDFIAWDDENHAAQHLVTVFGCTFLQALAAVRLANISSKREAA